MAKKEYSEAEQAAWKAGLAAGKKGSSRAGRGSTAARTAKRRTYKKGGKRKRSGKPRSGCTYEESYTIKATGEFIDRPRIRAWRVTETGIQRFTAFLSKNDGVPQNPKTAESAERFRVFVANMVHEGVGESKANCIYDTRYRTLKFIKLGLVAKPNSRAGGYFGKGGRKYQNRVKKSN